MCGIAEVLHNLEFTVSGSDMAENANTRRLQGMGAKIFIGHAGAQAAISLRQHGFEQLVVLFTHDQPADRGERVRLVRRHLPRHLALDRIELAQQLAIGLEQFGKGGDLDHCRAVIKHDHRHATVTGLQHVQLILLDGELQVLHVLVVLL